MINWNDLVYYSEDSPSRLRWISDRLCGHGRVMKKANDPAGWKNSQGYWQIGLGNGTFTCHRVIIMLQGHILTEGCQVDHIDGGRGNNDVSNLRVVSNSLNQKNRRRGSNNTSGKVGVYRTTVGERYAYWNAECASVTKGKIRKAFSISKFGEEGAFNLACAFRDAIVQEENEAGAGFTERHGSA